MAQPLTLGSQPKITKAERKGRGGKGRRFKGGKDGAGKGGGKKVALMRNMQQTKEPRQ